MANNPNTLIDEGNRYSYTDSNGIVYYIDKQIVGPTKITVGTTEPSNPSVNDLWIDTN